MKNIDKIRQMPADELAELLSNGTCTLCNDCGIDCFKAVGCVTGIKEWLESEAEL